jgi:hypothetical protein
MGAPNLQPPDAYAVLGVAPDASQAALKEAHRRLAWQHHPDRVAHADRAAATQRIQEINVAYGLVRTPAARARYDELRRQERGVLAVDWDELMVQAGRWAGRWWSRNEVPLRRAGERAAKRAHRAAVRVGATATTIAYVWLGLVFALAAQQLAGSGNVLPPLVGAAGGAVAGTIQARDRLRALDGHPPMRLPWLPVAVWLGLLGGVVALVYV